MPEQPASVPALMSLRVPLEVELRRQTGRRRCGGCRRRRQLVCVVAIGGIGSGIGDASTPLCLDCWGIRDHGA